MSYNAEKMGNLILNESKSIEERCVGYRKEILGAIVEILDVERKHKVQRTRIQKQIDDACYAAGDFLWRKRDLDNQKKETAK